MIEYVDLNTGFALMGFQDYSEFKRVKQLCIDKLETMPMLVSSVS